MMSILHILHRYWVAWAPSSSKIHWSASPDCLKPGTLSGCAVPAGCRGQHGHPGDPARAPWDPLWGHWGSCRGTLEILLRAFLFKYEKSLLYKERRDARNLPSGRAPAIHGVNVGAAPPQLTGALTELPPKLVSASHAAPAPTPHLETAHKALSPHRREEGGRRTSPTSPALPAWWV